MRSRVLLASDADRVLLLCFFRVPFWDLVPSTNPSCAPPEVQWAGWTVLGTWEKPDM